jgi:hypothetical protein
MAIFDKEKEFYSRPASRVRSDQSLVSQFALRPVGDVRAETGRAAEMKGKATRLLGCSADIVMRSGDATLLLRLLFHWDA